MTDCEAMIDAGRGSAAIRRHERAGEPLCEMCRLERNRLARVYYAKRNKEHTDA